MKSWCVSVCLSVSVSVWKQKSVRGHNFCVLWPILTNLVSLERSRCGLAVHQLTFYNSSTDCRLDAKNKKNSGCHNFCTVWPILTNLVSMERSWWGLQITPHNIILKLNRLHAGHQNWKKSFFVTKSRFRDIEILNKYSYHYDLNTGKYSAQSSERNLSLSQLEPKL